MHRTAVGLLLISICPLAGCGGGGSQTALPAPSHQGNMVAFPDGKGFVELMTEGEAGSRGGRKGQGKSQIVAYFYGPDGATAISPDPTDVKVKVGTADGSPVVSLTPQAKPPGRFASDPGNYPQGFRGQLDAKLGGEPVQVPFLFR